MPYKVTYRDLDLLTCTFGPETSYYCDSLTEIQSSTIDWETCDVTEEWSDFDTDCCGGLGVVSTYTGTGNDPSIPDDALYIAEYSTYNFSTCEITDTTCEYVDWCTHSHGPCEYWADGTLWPDTLYLVNADYLGGGGVGWDWGNSWMRQYDPIPVVYDEITSEWSGNYYFNDAIDGPICLHGRFSFVSSGFGIECGHAFTRATDTTGGICSDNLSYPSCEGSYSNLGDPQNNDMGATVRVYPQPIYLEYWRVQTASLRRATVKVMDHEGLSISPPGITSCTKATLPNTLVVSHGGSHVMTYSQGMYRGTNCVLDVLASEVPGGVVASNIAAATWYLVNATGDLLDVAEWTVADKVSCSPLLFTNGLGSSLSE